MSLVIDIEGSANNNQMLAKILGGEPPHLVLIEGPYEIDLEGLSDYIENYIEEEGGDIYISVRNTSILDDYAGLLKTVGTATVVAATI